MLIHVSLDLGLFLNVEKSSLYLLLNVAINYAFQKQLFAFEMQYQIMCKTECSKNKNPCKQIYPIPHPHTQYHTPHASYPIPYTTCLIPIYHILIPNTIHHMPHTQYHIPHASYPIPYTTYLIPNTTYLIPNTIHHIPHTQYHIPHTSYLIPAHVFSKDICSVCSASKVTSTVASVS